jgi:putative membrane protein
MSAQSLSCVDGTRSTLRDQGGEVIPMMGGGWTMMTLGPILTLGLIALVVWAVVRLTPSPSQRRNDNQEVGSGRNDAREILDRRFAAGELDTEAYQAAVHELNGPR